MRTERDNSKVLRTMPLESEEGRGEAGAVQRGQIEFWNAKELGLEH